MPDLGRTLIVVGLLLVVAGGLLVAGSRFGWSIPLGRLPGDIAIKRDGFAFYLPLGSSILVSVALSLLLYWLRR